jgi:two-component system chemotaxis response regulator CheB
METGMTNRGLVVIGGSAGAIEVLRALVAKLPADLPAAVLVVVHVPAAGRSMLVDILARAGSLPTERATEGQPPRPGRIYVARPNHHLMIRRGRLRVVRGPRENGHRPAIDPLFRSAAQERGPGCVGVVLSGNLDDGAAGLATIDQAGGPTLVQDPAHAAFSGMPAAALAKVPAATVVPAEELAGRIEELARQEVAAGGRSGDAGWRELNERELAIAELDTDELDRPDRPGEPAGLVCPDCGGPLYELDERGLPRYRCRVGHAWSPESLAVQQELTVENALWHAARVLREKARLHRQLAEANAARGRRPASTDRLHRTAAEADDSAGVIEQLLRDRPVP